MKTTFKILLAFIFFISGFQFTSVNAQGSRLPHLDYVPEFPYPVRIVKTSNDDTRIHKKIKYVTFMTSLTPVQVKTFYKHFLMKNGWGVDASINNQVFGAALVMHPKPGYTKDGRPIIYVGPLGGDDYQLRIDCKSNGTGSIVDLEYTDNCYKGRPTTTTISQKYYVPVINSK